jgi:DNA-binding MarR family transcriptional regulator
MDAVELYLLGRKLMKIGEGAFPQLEVGAPPTSVRMVLVDVSVHPNSSIGEITSRTGFPQSHVSASVAQLRDLGVLETSADPSDGRRTLVRLAPGMRRRATRRASAPVDAALGAALDGPDAAELAEIVAALELLAGRFMPWASGRSHSGSTDRDAAGGDPASTTVAAQR